MDGCNDGQQMFQQVKNQNDVLKEPTRKFYWCLMVKKADASRLEIEV